MGDCVPPNKRLKPTAHVASTALLSVGRFYSVPLGAEHIDDKDVVISLTFWIGAVALLIQWLIRRRQRAG